MNAYTKLKAAYAAWNDRKGDALDVFRELMDERCRLTSMGKAEPALRFAADRSSQEEVLQYLQDILDDWQMIHYTPHSLVSEGDRIAMFGTCAWRHKKTGKAAECMTAGIWRFENGKAVEFTDLFDTAIAAAAATP